MISNFKEVWGNPKTSKFWKLQLFISCGTQKSAKIPRPGAKMIWSFRGLILFFWSWRLNFFFKTRNLPKLPKLPQTGAKMIWSFFNIQNSQNLLVFGFPETSQNLISFRQLLFPLFAKTTPNWGQDDQVLIQYLVVSMIRFKLKKQTINIRHCMKAIWPKLERTKKGYWQKRTNCWTMVLETQTFYA